MQLPQDLQHFPSATLLVAADTVSAKFWLLGGDTMEELDGITEPHEKSQDHEGSYVSSDGSRTGGPDTGNEDADRYHHYVHDVVDHIAKLVHAQSIAHIHLVMSAELEHAVSDHLPKEVSTKIIKRVHADVMKESPLDLVRRVLAA